MDLFTSFFSREQVASLAIPFRIAALISDSPPKSTHQSHIASASQSPRSLFPFSLLLSSAVSLTEHRIAHSRVRIVASLSAILVRNLVSLPCRVEQTSGNQPTRTSAASLGRQGGDVGLPFVTAFAPGTVGHRVVRLPSRSQYEVEVVRGIYSVVDVSRIGQHHLAVG